MDLWVKLDKFWRKKKILFVFKGYTCRFKSEAFASFASIALRPCLLAANLYQGNPDRNHKPWNIVSTERYTLCCRY